MASANSSSWLLVHGNLAAGAKTFTVGWNQNPAVAPGERGQGQISRDPSGSAMPSLQLTGTTSVIPMVDISLRRSHQLDGTLSFRLFSTSIWNVRSTARAGDPGKQAS
jgi:hypothetical protein